MDSLFLIYYEYLFVRNRTSTFIMYSLYLYLVWVYGIHLGHWNHSIMKKEVMFLYEIWNFIFRINTQIWSTHSLLWWWTCTLKLVRFWNWNIISILEKSLMERINPYFTNRIEFWSLLSYIRMNVICYMYITITISI